MEDRKVKLYDQLVARCSGFDRKGKTMPYTSANGHMFSQLNKDGQLGIRFSREVQEKYIRELDTDYFRSYGAVMKGYVLMPESLWETPDKLAAYLQESYAYILTLDPK